ncbi:F(420)H(2) dehydrogenase subunit L [uncultured archaeon]|nr:F(420)H(2) dehydrogenase subunit L [uncultured archaeon]
MIELIVAFPVVSALACLLPQLRPRHAEAVAMAGALLSLLALLATAATGDVSAQPVSGLFGIMRMDSLGLLFTAVTSVVALFVFAYSPGYMQEEVREGVFEEKRIGRYYALMLFFLASMLLVTLASDLLTTWAALESTTLASVFLISFYNKKESVEAAWKYFITCSLGITLALVGLMLLAYGMQQAGVQESFAWENVLANAQKINTLYLKIAFAFIFVGYGTKMGLVPLHVWLPDAHSQAPTPVSALLSGVLLNAALYSILRLYPVAAQNPEVAAFISSLFLFFGVISLALASLRLYSQENYKRLLAYSSVENMGIIALGVGIGGPLGMLAALFHMVSHSLIKPLAFFMGGIISLAYGTKEISKISGAAQKMPAIGQSFVLVNIGIAGSIPFGAFISEIILLAAALSTGNYAIAALLIIFTTVAFGTLLMKSSHMAFGPFAGSLRNIRPGLLMKASVLGLFLLAVVLGLFAPQLLLGLLSPAISVLLRGS